MKLDQLRHFYETARHQHMGRAAQILNISPSGISYSIECLERDLGVKLFAKRGKRIFLTSEGQRLMDRIPQVQRTIDDLKAHVCSTHLPLGGRYRLAGSHLLADLLVAPLCGQLMTDHPQLSFELFSLRSSQVVSQVLEGDIDLGICYSPQEHPQLDTATVSTGELRVYVRKNHPMMRETLAKRRLRQLSEYPAILPKAFGGIEDCQSHPVFERHGIEPRPGLAFDHYGVGVQAVCKSDGWGFFADWVEEMPRFPLAALDLPRTWDAPYSIRALWRRDRYLDLGIKTLVARLVDPSNS